MNEILNRCEEIINQTKQSFEIFINQIQSYRLFYKQYGTKDYTYIKQENEDNGTFFE